MKKIYFGATCLIVCAFLFGGCSETAVSEPIDDGHEVETPPLIIPSEEYDVKYLRCSDYLGQYFTLETHPPYFFLRTLTEFENVIAPLVESDYAYIYYHADLSDLTVMGRKFQLEEAVDEYTDEFFKDYNLVMISLVEPSGSIRHEIKTISIVNNTELAIKMDRILPLIGTTDIAYWYIFIPIRKDDYNGNDINIEIIDVPFVYDD